MIRLLTTFQLRSYHQPREIPQNLPELQITTMPIRWLISILSCNLICEMSFLLLCTEFIWLWPMIKTLMMIECSSFEADILWDGVNQLMEVLWKGCNYAGTKHHYDRVKEGFNYVFCWSQVFESLSQRPSCLGKSVLEHNTLIRNIYNSFFISDPNTRLVSQKLVPHSDLGIFLCWTFNFKELSVRFILFFREEFVDLILNNEHLTWM